MGASYLAVVDFGGQYAHLIARRVRELGYHSRVFSPQVRLETLAEAKGVILSGGPRSVFAADAVPFNEELLSLEVPLLGLCYGHQLLVHHLGGTVEQAEHGEYGRTRLSLCSQSEDFRASLTAGLPRQSEVWMSHGDKIRSAPAGFAVLGETSRCAVAVMADPHSRRYGLQFHPEVRHTEHGQRWLRNFCELTGAAQTWTPQAQLDAIVRDVQRQVGARRVLMFLSGGVDSSVAFLLLVRALGKDRVHGLLIDTGFMRADEVPQIMTRYADLGLAAHITCVDESPRFLDAVAGLCDAEAKRRAIGDAFVAVHEGWLRKMSDTHGHAAEGWLLGQGTLYPDIIESGGSAHAERIKLHHNRSPAVEALIAAGRVVEPLRDLYKDEVRTLGRLLGLPAAIVERHPFPGPGLAINVICHPPSQRSAAPPARTPSARTPAVQTPSALAPSARTPAVQTPSALAPSALAPSSLRALEVAAEKILRRAEHHPYRAQALPVLSVGVQGDRRSYAPPLALRGPLDWERLEATSIALTNGIPQLNRVVIEVASRRAASAGVLGWRARGAFCSRERLDLLREVEALVRREVPAAWMRQIFQLLVILLPLTAAEEEADGGLAAGEGVVLRPVQSEDVMTARFAPLAVEVLGPLAEAILAAQAGVEAVFFDVTHKPPATFGWE